jgi:hypothetical protein
MKKAKIILTCVGLLAVIGGAAAFKASRFELANVWYIPANQTTRLTVTSAVPNGPLYTTTIPNCTLSNQVTTDVGPDILTSTTSTNINVTTVFTRANPNPALPPLSFTTTYSYCVPILTKTALANG